MGDEVFWDGIQEYEDWGKGGMWRVEWIQGMEHTWQIGKCGFPSCEGCGCRFGEGGSCGEAAEGTASGGGGAEERGRHFGIAVEVLKL